VLPFKFNQREKENKEVRRRNEVNKFLCFLFFLFGFLSFGCDGCYCVDLRMNFEVKREKGRDLRDKRWVWKMGAWEGSEREREIRERGRR
jgi:nitrate reductase NapE component